MSDDAARLMDRMYRPQRHIYDLTRKPYLLGRDHLIAALRPPPGGRVLEIGCGTGRNLIRAGRRYEDARLYGIDISGVMLDAARAQIARAGLRGRITLARADAARFDATALWSHGAFDRIFVSYALSMIPAWQAVIALALDHLAPNGTLHIVDFGDQAELPPWFAPLLNQWLRLFHVTPRVDAASILAEAAERSGRPLSCVSLYRGYAFYAEIGAAADNTK